MKAFVPQKVTLAVFKEIKHMLKQRKWIPMTYEQISLYKNVGLKTIQLINRSKNYQQYIANVRKGKMNYGFNPSEKVLAVLLIVSFAVLWLYVVAFLLK